MQETLRTEDTLAEERLALFERLSSALAMHGQILDRETFHLLQPLLSGAVGYEELRGMLEQRLASIFHE